MSPTAATAFKLISGGAHPALANALAAELGVALSPAEITPFADGERRVHVPGPPHPRLEIVSLAPLLAQCVRKLCGLDA